MQHTVVRTASYGGISCQILSAGGRFSDVTGRHGLDGCRTDL